MNFSSLSKLSRTLSRGRSRSSSRDRKSSLGSNTDPDSPRGADDDSLAPLPQTMASSTGKKPLARVSLKSRGWTPFMRQTKKAATTGTRGKSKKRAKQKASEQKKPADIIFRSSVVAGNAHSGLAAVSSKKDRLSTKSNPLAGQHGKVSGSTSPRLPVLADGGGDIGEEEVDKENIDDALLAQLERGLQAVKQTGWPQHSTVSNEDADADADAAAAAGACNRGSVECGAVLSLDRIHGLGSYDQLRVHFTQLLQPEGGTGDAGADDAKGEKKKGEVKVSDGASAVALLVEMEKKKGFRQMV